jgi:hypothetical protein
VEKPQMASEGAFFLLPTPFVIFFVFDWGEGLRLLSRERSSWALSSWFGCAFDSSKVCRHSAAHGRRRRAGQNYCCRAARASSEASRQKGEGQGREARRVPSWRMLPFKKRKLVLEQVSSEGELDDSNEKEGDADTTPAWHCEFQLDNRSSLVPDPTNAWVVKAQEVSSKLRARVLKHVRWWNKDALNPDESDMYILPHLIFAHDTGVMDFSISPVLCKSLLSYLENEKSYDDKGYLILAGKSHPGYARYPYVHARSGQLPSVQEVCVRLHTEP